MPQHSTRRSFSQANLTELLSRGWIFSLRPDQILLGWGEIQSLAEAPNGTAIYAPDFRLQDVKPWKQTQFWDFCDVKTFTDIVMAAVAVLVNVPTPFNWTEPSHLQFAEKFTLIGERLKAGILQKAVPVVFATTSASLDPDRILRTLQSLLQLPNTLHLYGFWDLAQDSSRPDNFSEGIIGATPERLLRLDGLRRPAVIETMALAGTRAKNGVHDDTALLNDPKERAEHQFVIDDIAKTLATLGTVQVGQTSVVELPTLFHLKTPISVELDGTHAQNMNLARACKLLHPTPALGVAPRRLGFGEMDRWDDGVFRRRFGAPFGVSAMIEPDRKIEDCLVAIRNIQWNDKSVVLGSGCGVIQASEQEREWQELKLKRDSVKRMLGV